MADKLSAMRRSENMRRIKSRDTKPEMVVRRAVHGMGYRYRLHSPKLPGKPDLVLARLKKIIDIRGCFWHLHKGCIDCHFPKSRVGYWLPKLKTNKARDQRNTRAWRTRGYGVLVLWECELTNAPRLHSRLRKFLTS